MAAAEENPWLQQLDVEASREMWIVLGRSWKTMTDMWHVSEGCEAFGDVTVVPRRSTAPCQIAADCMLKPFEALATVSQCSSAIYT